MKFRYMNLGAMNCIITNIIESIEVKKLANTNPLAPDGLVCPPEPNTPIKVINQITSSITGKNKLSAVTFTYLKNSNIPSASVLFEYSYQAIL